MKKYFIAIQLVFLTICAYGTLQIEKQLVDSVEVSVQKILRRDIKTIKPHFPDSVIVNEYLLKISLFTKVRNDSAIFYCNRVILAAEKAGFPAKVSNALQLLGQYYMLEENFPRAITCFINALKIEEKLENEKRIAELGVELGNVYHFQEIFGKALDYNIKALKIFNELHDTINIATVLSHIGLLYHSREYCEQRTSNQKREDHKIALDYFFQSMGLFENMADLNGIANQNINIGAVYNRMNQPEFALGYVEKALSYFQKKNDREKISGTLYSMGLIYNRLMNYDKALRCFNEAKDISLKERYMEGIQYLYEAIAQTYSNQLNFKSALDYYLKYMIVRDSVYNKDKSHQIFELEAKYQVEKKQNEIEKLIIVKQQRTYIIYALIITFLMISLLFWTYFRNIRNKNIISEQKLLITENKIIELEKERQLAAAKSVLLGEEAERTRLAGDLHDGLGGLLTGVKLELSSMKENSIITNENLANFNHALNLLDTSISELRRVAHNLMPETLMHFGLRTALSDFIQQVSPSGLPYIRFNTFGEDLRFSMELEVTIYRITQELITNAIKHANAKVIEIQLFTEVDRICVQVVDNGIGFEPERLDPNKKGHGLKNIQDRATAFNGRFEILSQPGKGSESTIEFLIS